MKGIKTKLTESDGFYEISCTDSEGSYISTGKYPSDVEVISDFIDYVKSGVLFQEVANDQYLISDFLEPDKNFFTA